MRTEVEGVLLLRTKDSSLWYVVCLSVSLHILSTCLSTCRHLFVCLPICLSTFVSIYLSVYLSICLSIYLSIYLSTYLPTDLSSNIHIYQSIYDNTHLPSPCIYSSSPPLHAPLSPLPPDIIRLTSLHDGQTALHRAANSDQHKIVSLLLNEDPQCANIQDTDGNTALHQACRKAHKNTIKTLLVRKLVSAQQK